MDFDPKDFDFTSEIENSYEKINKISNQKNFLSKRNQELRYKKIPYIKENSFYIKHYSNDIFEQLLLYLRKHYDELKN